MPGPIILRVSCKSADDLLTHLSPQHDLWRSTGGQTNWVFRGQNRDRPLLPSSMRSQAFWNYGIGGAGPLTKPINLYEQLKNEQDALTQFVDKCISLGLEIPEDGQLIRSGFAAQMAPQHQADLLQGQDFPHPLLRSLFALAQHHGVPTRLLDWSRSAWTGAYFACEKAARAGKLQERWDKEKKDFEEDGLGKLPADPRPQFDSEEIMVVWALRNLVFCDSAKQADKLGFDIVEVTAPYHANPNLRAQKGIFTLIRSTVKVATSDFVQPPLEEAVKTVASANYILNKDGTFDNGPLMVKFSIPHAKAGRVLRDLNDYDISFGAVFPGYDGALGSIRERQFWT